MTARAAFFDLDRTLIAGSSAYQFGRASYQAGLMTRRQLARDAWANVKFRLQGSTDEATEALRERIFTSIKGRRVQELQRLGAAACSPACCRASTRGCSRSPTATRTRGGRSTSSPRRRRRWPS